MSRIDQQVFEGVYPNPEFCFRPLDEEVAQSYCYVPTNAFKKSRESEVRDRKIHDRTTAYILTLQGLSDRIESPQEFAKQTKEKPKQNTKSYSDVLVAFFEAMKGPDVVVNIGGDHRQFNEKRNFTHHKQPVESSSSKEEKGDKKSDGIPPAVWLAIGIVGLGVLTFFGYKSGEAAAKLEAQKEGRANVQEGARQWTLDKREYYEGGNFARALEDASWHASKILDRHVDYQRTDLIIKVMAATAGLLFVTSAILTSVPVLIAAGSFGVATVGYFGFSQGSAELEESDKNDNKDLKINLELLRAYGKDKERNKIDDYTPPPAYNPHSFEGQKLNSFRDFTQEVLFGGAK